MRDLFEDLRPRLRRSKSKRRRPPNIRRPVPEVKNATRPLWALAAETLCWISSGVAVPSMISLKF
jgi:hypothetical protein